MINTTKDTWMKYNFYLGLSMNLLISEIYRYYF